MNPTVILSIVSAVVFTATLIVLLVRKKDVSLSTDVFVPLSLSIVLYGFITLSNSLEHSGITDFFDPIEDIAEIVFTLMYLFFVNNWRKDRSETRFRDLFRFAPISLAEVTTTGSIIRINDNMIKKMDLFFDIKNHEYLTLDDLLSHTHKDEHRETMTMSWKKSLELSYKTGSSIPPSELEITIKDGTKRTLIVGANIIDENYLFSMIDITEQKQTEQSLRESETRFKALHNASFGGITIHDKGIILECNQGLSDITGYTSQELIGMNGLLLISEKTRDMVMKNILAGYEKPYEAIGLKKNGEEFPLRLEARNIPYKGKNVRTVEFRDITEAKNAEAEKEKLKSQLLQAQKIESLGRLAGGVAHDFNNMLSVILGYTELTLEKIDENNPIRKDLNEVHRAAKRSADITRQLLAFARQQTVAPKILDLNDTIESMLKMLRRLIGEDIDLVWNPGTTLWPVLMDPSQVDQIMANLCVNSRDAINGVGKITIETQNIHFDNEKPDCQPDSVCGDYVQLTVSDNGKGMTPEIIENLFEPFFTTKDINKGTGLGLATVYGIVKQNKGFIRVNSELSLGAVFRICLPRHYGDVVAPVKTVKAGDTCGNETILLVEDEPSILHMTTTMLKKLGYTVLYASTASDAIKLSKNHGSSIDLVMTDVIMPEMNGRELVEILQTEYPNIKRLFMSGYTADVISKHGVLDEGVEFIQKPFTMHDLAAGVRRALD